MTFESIQSDPSGHFLVTASGRPFFWLGDTAWEMFHRLNRPEAEVYLETRRMQGFNVIQAVILAELDGRYPNANGHIPLLGDDPARPNEYYFRHVDDLIRLAEGKGLYIGLLPTWGDKVDRNSTWGSGPAIFTVENARVYGKFLGERYRNDANILWILGGDRSPHGCEPVWAAMAEGIIEGLGRRPFFSYHPQVSSSEWLHEADWLDMNMWQSGHILLDAPNWDMIGSDYRRIPAKPVLDAEPAYEGHPIDPFMRSWKPEFGRFTEHDVRKQAYRAVLSGACGHTYGHHSVWQFWTLERSPINFPMPTWEEAIYTAGAGQMIHLKDLVLSRPYLTRVPAQEILVGEPEIPPIDEREHFHPLRAAHPCAARGSDGAYAMVYIPNAGQTIRLDLSQFTTKLKGWWFDPRTGMAYPAGEYPNGRVSVTTPIAGPDWVLVVDDPSKFANPPGAAPG
jgi:hypothetical protein